MVKPLACHTGRQCLNPYTAQDFLNSEKIISAPILSGTPPRALYLSQLIGVTLETGDWLRERLKRGIVVKILVVASVWQIQI